MLLRMRPEGLGATCPLTARQWKMSPEWGLLADNILRIKGGGEELLAFRVGNPESTSLNPFIAAPSCLAPVTCS